MPIHPTQVFLSNPSALRAEYRVDDARLELWWSPAAGESTDCRDRNYSSRDAHLDVFDEIILAGCELEHFRSCDYDPYHCLLHFERQVLHLAIAVDAPIVYLWAEQPQAVEFKTGRFDLALRETRDAFAVRHATPRYTFEFAAQTGPGEGGFRHCRFHAPEHPYFARAELAEGQLLAVGVGLEGEGIGARLAAVAREPVQSHLERTDAGLAPVEAMGNTVSPSFPDLAQLRRTVVRGLHSMIDESGAYRASLKNIYYLLWVRDAGFSFAYQSAAGWPHRLPELCRLLLDNPVTVRDPDLPAGRMFGQLIHRDLGKLEEDGTYYVVWTLFTQWTQNGDLGFMTDADWALIDESLAWVERMTWDEQRGLYGEHFADETAAAGWRDQGWDYAIGKPLGTASCIRHDGQDVARNYDVYFNLIMHSTYTMLAAMRGEERYARTAERVWPELEKLLQIRRDGVPAYGEVLLTSGERRISHYWGEARSCCIWGLTMPNFAPLSDWDDVLAATMDAIITRPDMH